MGRLMAMVLRLALAQSLVRLQALKQVAKQEGSPKQVCF
jgi:hypothetical protein